jgi:hypothetical protein
MHLGNGVVLKYILRGINQPVHSSTAASSSATDKVD